MDTIKISLTVEGPKEEALSTLEDVAVSLWAAHMEATDKLVQIERLNEEVSRLQFAVEQSQTAPHEASS